uniref:Nuclear pore complex protein Nup153 n=1 Tax=Anopheles epiroticus TaxID=199890 RepID=A0A182PNT8_9DIPT
MSYIGQASSPRRTNQHSDEGEDCDEEESGVTPTAQNLLSASFGSAEEDSHDRSDSQYHGNTDYSGCENDADQSVVGKIRSNVTKILSKIVRNAKNTVISPHRQPEKKGTIEQDVSGRQTREQMAAEPRKRRHSLNLQDGDEQEGEDRAGCNERPQAEQQTSDARRNVRTYEMIMKRRRLHQGEEPAPAPLPRRTNEQRTSRVSRFAPYSTTNRIVQSGRVSNEWECTNRRGLFGSVNNGAPQSLFGRPASALSSRNTRSASVFRSSALFHSTQTNETPVEAEEEERQEKEEERESSAGDGSRRFDPLKLFENFNDGEHSEASHRMTGFLGNTHYRSRLGEMNRGMVGKLFFSSHKEPAKSLYSSGSELSSFSQRPSFNRGAYGGSTSSIASRIPPEYGGSPFYDGLTRYGGASAARTLATSLQRSPLHSSSTVLTRAVPPSSTNTLDGKRLTARRESSAPCVSSVAQRIEKILDDYAIAKKNGDPSVEAPTNSSIRLELEELTRSVYSRRTIGKPYGEMHTPRIPEILQMLRDQQTTSILNEPVEYVPQPPPPIAPSTVPLMEYGLLQRSASSSEPSNASISNAKKARVTELRPSVELAKTREESSPAGLSQKTASNLSQAEQRREPPSSVFPLSQPVQEKKKTTVNGNVEALSDNAEEERRADEDGGEEKDEDEDKGDDQDDEKGEGANLVEKDDTDKGMQDVKGGEPCQPTSVLRFTFSEPIVLGVPITPEPVTVPPTSCYVFAEPESLTNDLVVQARSFKELMAESANKWVCDVCMIRNEPHREKCVACESAKPAAKTPAQQQKPMESLAKSTPPARSFHELMAESAGKWACDVCMIRNEPQRDKCVACESAKPAAKKPEQQQKQSVPATAPAVRSFQELMAESADKWVCDVCMIKNEPQKEKCVACESAKPAKKPEKQQQQSLPTSNATMTGTMSDSFAAIVSAQSAQWECAACGVRNENSVAVCVCCATAKSNGAPENSTHGDKPKEVTMQTSSSNAAVSVPLFSNVPGLKDVFKSLVENMKTTTWLCDTCMTRNSIELNKCLCCEQDRPGGVTGSSNTTSTASEVVMPVPKLTFGMPTTDSSTIESNKAGIASAPATSSPSRTGGFKFGAFNGVDRGASSSSAPAPAAFTFNAPAKGAVPCEPVKTVAPQASKSSFSFSNITSSENSTAAMQPSAAFVFGASSKVPSATGFQSTTNIQLPTPQQQEQQPVNMIVL